MNYEPYNMEAWKELLLKANRLGWYGGTHDLITLTVEGGFEHNLSSRATESWNCIYVITTTEVKDDKGNVLWPQVEAKAETIGEASRKVLNLMSQEPTKL